MLLLVAAVVAVALNQRPAVVALAPVLDLLRADTGLSSAVAGLLTTLPVLCFGAFAPVAPKLARRIGLETAVAASLLLLTLGMAARLLSPLALLFAGTVVLGAAIAIVNVLLPAYIKREFFRPGPVMGLYTASINIGAAAAAAATVPLATALDVDWRVGLGMWVVLTVAALVFWLPTLRAGASHRRVLPEVLPESSWSLLRQPLARQITAFFGFQSVQFYTYSAWLPAILADAGIPLGEGGLLLGLSNVVGAVPALVLPAIAGAMRTQRPLLVAVMTLFTVGLGGLLVAPASGAVVWVCAFGVAQGGGFALALTLFVLRSDTSTTAARLGGVAQCLGYTMAAAGPLAVGAVHDLTGDWTWPVGLLLILLAPMTWVGWGATDDAVVTSSEKPSRTALPA
ncbi:MAG: MFS transporter [Actinomycetota bacterium]|nr:MFS transporter [Actinomycetota bacterium]